MRRNAHVGTDAAVRIYIHDVPASVAEYTHRCLIALLEERAVEMGFRSGELLG